MRRLYLVLPFVVLVFAIRGHAQTTSQHTPPQIGWSLSEVAQNLGTDTGALAITGERSGDGLLMVKFTGRLFGQEGMYILGFDEDTLLAGSHWFTDVPQEDRPSDVFNSLRDKFKHHRYEYNKDSDTSPAEPTDDFKSIEFYRGSTSHGLFLMDSTIRVNSSLAQ